MLPFLFFRLNRNEVLDQLPVDISTHAVTNLKKESIFLDEEKKIGLKQKKSISSSPTKLSRRGSKANRGRQRSRGSKSSKKSSHSFLVQKPEKESAIVWVSIAFVSLFIFRPFLLLILLREDFCGVSYNVCMYV